MKLKNKRGAGILLPISALPSPYGIGTLGKSAYQFVDWLKEAGQTYWQVLPIGPTSYGDSPYQSFSAFAGNPYFIDLDILIEEGLLRQSEVDAVDWGDHDTEAAYGTIDYAKIFEARFDILKKAYARSKHKEKESYQKFLRRNAYWIDDYSMYMALKVYFGQKAWTEWDDEIRFRKPEAMDKYRVLLADEIDFWKFLQYKFQKQWKKLRKYANKNGVKIIGDIPIYVAMDSADVWSHPELFQLDDKSNPVAVAGCPPDGFSATGQLWGNPLYRWDYHRETGFDWWMSRVWYAFNMYDVLRIDHFRGFDEYYSIPYGAKDATNGHWEKGPGMDLFNTMKWRLGDRRVIAEDLGFMTDTVRQLVKDSGFPGMKVLEFAFDSRDTGAASDYLPHNYIENCVVYTGTHDNETLQGWFKSINKQEMQMVRDYLCDAKTPIKDLHKPMIAAAMRSNAATCIIPMQDYLGLDNSARTNQPSTVGQNWRWRVSGKALTSKLAQEIRHTAETFGRL